MLHQEVWRESSLEYEGEVGWTELGHLLDPLYKGTACYPFC